jgi:hypothetical protein
MKGELKTAFETARTSIMHEPARSARITQGRFILIDIMRSANQAAYAAAMETAEDKTSVERLDGFHPETLKAQGIDPKSFREAMAFAYAYETLGFHNNQPPYQDVVFNRCNTCLDTSDEYSFGNLLPDKIKNDIVKKLEINGFTCSYPQGLQH